MILLTFASEVPPSIEKIKQDEEKTQEMGKQILKVIVDLKQKLLESILAKDLAESQREDLEEKARALQSKLKELEKRQEIVNEELGRELQEERGKTSLALKESQEEKRQKEISEQKFEDVKAQLVEFLAKNSLLQQKVEGVQKVLYENQLVEERMKLTLDENATLKKEANSLNKIIELQEKNKAILAQIKSDTFDLSHFFYVADGKAKAMSDKFRKEDNVYIKFISLNEVSASLKSVPRLAVTNFVFDHNTIHSNDVVILNDILKQFPNLESINLDELVIVDKEDVSDYLVTLSEIFQDLSDKPLKISLKNISNSLKDTVEWLENYNDSNKTNLKLEEVIIEFMRSIFNKEINVTAASGVESQEVVVSFSTTTRECGIEMQYSPRTPRVDIEPTMPALPVIVPTLDLSGLQ